MGGATSEPVPLRFSDNQDDARAACRPASTSGACRVTIGGRNHDGSGHDRAARQRDVLRGQRGLDAGDFVLVAYGGAGPVHAVDVAREIGIRSVIVPGAPGVFSAFGMLFSDLRYDYVRTHLMLLPEAPFDEIEAVFKELEQNGRDAIAATSVKPQRIAVKRALDMRYIGQEHPVTVELPMRIFQGDER